MTLESGGGDLVKCTFCGKTQQTVKKLIAGPGVYICNECIDLCNDIIEEETGGLDAAFEGDVTLPRATVTAIARLLDQAVGAVGPTNARVTDEASRLAKLLHARLQVTPPPDLDGF